jgi:alpha-ribazole phosphatase/probable phosphoglycerate mutase
MFTTELILIRHGHTASNGGEGPMRLSGWHDVPLSWRGHREAAQAALRLWREGPIAAVYASPLQRATSTAAYLVEVLGTELREHPGLREIGCGTVDGWTVDSVKAALPAVWLRNELQQDDDFRWPGGESYRELRARSVAAIGEIGERHAGKRVVLVTHAGVITQIAGCLSGLPAARWDVYRAGNASITRLELRGGRLRLVRFDDRDHLPDHLPEEQRERVPTSRRRAG